MQTFEKNNKNYKLLGTDSAIKKLKKGFCDSISIITLYCVSVVVLYSGICNQISDCDMI